MGKNKDLKSKKPINVSKYLVLKDLINGVDVRSKVDFIHYLTSRIENVKCDLANEGLEFQESVLSYTSYSHYKPYLLVPSVGNIKKAEQLLKKYETKEILEFLSNRQDIDCE